jgi:hypothetical protein
MAASPAHWFFVQWRFNPDGEVQNAIQQKYPTMPFQFGEDGGVTPDGFPSPKWTILRLLPTDATTVKNDLDVVKFPNADMAKIINQLTTAEWAAFVEPVTAAGVDLAHFPATATVGDIVNYMGRLINPAFDWHHYS